MVLKLCSFGIYSLLQFHFSLFSLLASIASCANKVPVSMLNDFSVNRFMQMFDSKEWEREKQRPNQIDGWKLKVIINIWLLLEFDWKWVDEQRTQILHNFLCAILFSVCVSDIRWWNTFYNWPSRYATEKERENQKRW